MKRKTKFSAYFLAFLGGALGLHQLYLGNPHMFVLYLFVVVVCVFFPPALLVLAVIFLFDLFRIPAMVRECNRIAG